MKARSFLLLALVALACSCPARAEPVTSDSINTMMVSSTRKRNVLHGTVSAGSASGTALALTAGATRPF